METFSALLAISTGNSTVTGEFPSQRLVTRCFDLRLNKRLSKQLCGWRFETPSRSLWRHRNDLYHLAYILCRSSPVNISWRIDLVFIGFWKVKFTDINTGSFTKYNYIALTFVRNPNLHLHTIGVSFKKVAQAFTVGYRKILWVFMFVTYIHLKGELFFLDKRNCRSLPCSDGMVSFSVSMKFRWYKITLLKSVYFK